jgi:CubicO group peptidase (beta-lactamase class C family)
MLPAVLSGQTLTQQIQSIKTGHDLMGGVVTVLCGNQVLESIPFGMADYGRTIPVSDSTVFRIASISKTITAIAFMQLYEQGLFTLNQDINSILGYPVRNPSFPNTAITPRMLLSHTSSIIDGATYSSFLNATSSQNPIPNLSELLTPSGSYYAAGQFNNIQPGTYYNYANINFGIIGTLIEKLSNERFDVYCRQHILQPLGISGSFNVTDLPDINDVAVLYRKVSGNWVPQADNYLGVYPVYSNLSGYIPGTNGLRFGPQGNLRISGNDLSKLFQLLMNHGSWNGVTLLQDSTVNKMIAVQWQYNGSNGNNYYGLFRSWGLGIHRITNTPNQDVVLPGSQLMFGHTGEAYGLISDAYIDTTRNVGLVFITNGCGTGYSTNSQSAFYTVEKEIFDAIESVVGVTNCLTTAISDPEMDSRIMVCPNPSNGNFTIRTNGFSLPSTVEIYRIDGALISRYILTEPLSVRLQNRGLYLIRVTSGKEVKTTRIVVE